jgi:RHS repeat-associated protein
MYLSNESPILVDIYFACVPELRQRYNDVTMTLTPSNVIKYNACSTEAKWRREYYPFVPIASGMQTANSWTRDTATKNNFLGNGGTELNTTSQLYDLEYRNYDPALGRMNGVDPLANKYSSLTPYNYSFNNPVMFNDPSGADPPQTINYSAQTSHWFIYCTYDDRIDETELRFGSAVCGQCWRTGNADAMAFYAGATGGREFGMSMSFGALSYSGQGRAHAAQMRSDKDGLDNSGYRDFPNGEAELAYAMSYNDQHSSWSATEYKSRDATIFAYLWVKQTGVLPSLNAVIYHLNRQIVNGRWSGTSVTMYGSIKYDKKCACGPRTGEYEYDVSLLEAKWQAALDRKLFSSIQNSVNVIRHLGGFTGIEQWDGSIVPLTIGGYQMN